MKRAGDGGEAPDAKRRVADVPPPPACDTAAKVGDVSASGEVADVPQLPACETIALVLCDDSSFPGGHSQACPTFTHQGFGEEQLIRGFDALDVRILLADPSMHALLAVDGSPVAPDATDVEACAAGGLPPGYTTAPDGFRGKLGEGLPPGVADGDPLMAYTVNDTSFDVFGWQLDTPGKQAYHARLQKLAWWFIDGCVPASDIDVTSPRWEVFGVFTRGRRFVAYATVYTFSNPVRKSRPDSLRVCQVLVLPAYQRQGHGARLMECIYAAAIKLDAFEVTMEDPAPGMSRLRDAVDVALLKRSGLADALLSETTGADGLPPPPTAAAVEHIARQLRITSLQAVRSYEALLLSRIPGDNIDQLKRFRLQVKRRLFAQEGMQDVEAGVRKRILDEMFQAEEAAYKAALAKLPPA